MDREPNAMDDPPTEITANGTRRWLKDGKLHREGDRPAVINSDDERRWYRNGRPHRGGDHPAVIWPSGTRWWYIFDRRSKITKNGTGAATVF